MISRRRLLKILSSLPFGGLVAGGRAGNSTSRVIDKIDEAAGYRDFYKELGLRTFINAQGTWTYLTGSLMRPEVVDAINYASRQYVNFNEIQDKVGRRLAEMGKSEDAMVTAGAASALTLGTAACITGKDEEKIRLLPNLPGPQREVIIQSSHRFAYDHTVRNTGIRLVEVETRQELKNAVQEKLRNGHPSIEVLASGDFIRISMWMARPGEERVVAHRLQEVLESGRV